jgi:hypothetical protein
VRTLQELIAAHGDLRQALYDKMMANIAEMSYSQECDPRFVRTCAETAADFLEPTPLDTAATEAQVAYRILAKMLGRSNTDKYIAVGGGKLDLNISRLELTGSEDMLVSRMMKR